MGVIRKDLIHDGHDKEQITTQITGRSNNMLDFNRLLEKVKMEQQTESSKDGPIELNIKYDRSAKDIGVLLKLNNLMKRLDTVKHITGDWKSANHKYANVTE